MGSERKKNYVRLEEESIEPAGVNHALITMDEVKDRIRDNVLIVDAVKAAVGPINMREAYQSVGLTWPAFENALNRGSSLGEVSRGRRKGRMSGAEALVYLTTHMTKRSKEEFAGILEGVARELRAGS
jgi:hypothetical protein